jgi:tartrate dehydratase beta subunit/fumarate hydratase class I family protein
MLLGYWVVLSAGADVWSTTWRNIAALVILAVGGAAYLMALAVVRTAAAIAYLELDGHDSLAEAQR